MNSPEIRLLVLKEGLSNFVSGDLQEKDLVGMDWCGDALHIESMRRQLRATQITADTLGIFHPDGSVVSKGYVVHNKDTAESTISQLATYPSLQSLGFGTYLVAALEARIQKRGNRTAVLGVETSNPRAHALYSRLGYTYVRTAEDSWQAVNAAGNPYTHTTEVAWLAKEL